MHSNIIANKVNNPLESNHSALDEAIEAVSPSIMDSGLQFSQATPGMTTWDSVRQGSAGDKSDKSPAGTVIKSTVCDGEDSLAKHNQTCAGNTWVVVGECQAEQNKYFAKKIYCGKEWCPVCGQKLSRMHRRRIARVLKKAMQIQAMGYFVIEFPDKYRKDPYLAYSKRGLQDFTNKIVEVFAGKRMGRRGRVDPLFIRGLLRWHWFGDKMNGKWNPHLNILVDGGFIEPDRLEAIKAMIREAAGIPDLIINYSYADEDKPGKKYHFVEYITRATFKNYDWNPYMAEQLYGFRNQRWWGKWNDPACWHVEPEMEANLLAADALDGGHCPDCGGDLEWSKPVHPAYLTIWQAEEIGQTGFYRIPVREFTGDHLTPRQIMTLDAMEWTVVANSIMRVRDKNTVWNETLAYIDDNDFIEYELPGEVMREVQGDIWLN